MNLLAPLFPRHDRAMIDKLCELDAIEERLMLLQVKFDLLERQFQSTARRSPIREPRKDKGSIIKAREATKAALRKAVGR